MIEFIFPLLAVGALAFAWWFLSRRRRDLLGGTSAREEDTGWPTQAQALNRDALLNREREFDPSAWDDSPDPARSKPAKSSARPAPPRPAPSRPAPSRPAQPRPAPGEEEDEAPAFFDREFLERKQRERSAGDAAPLPPPVD